VCFVRLVKGRGNDMLDRLDGLHGPRFVGDRIDRMYGHRVSSTDRKVGNNIFDNRVPSLFVNGDL
jgi:hypothetical protein